MPLIDPIFKSEILDKNLYNFTSECRNCAKGLVRIYHSHEFVKPTLLISSFQQNHKNRSILDRANFKDKKTSVIIIETYLLQKNGNRLKVRGYSALS